MSDPRTLTLERELWAALAVLVNAHPRDLPENMVIPLLAALRGAAMLGKKD